MHDGQGSATCTISQAPSLELCLINLPQSTDIVCKGPATSFCRSSTAPVPSPAQSPFKDHCGDSVRGSLGPQGWASEMSPSGDRPDLRKASPAEAPGAQPSGGRNRSRAGQPVVRGRKGMVPAEAQVLLKPVGRTRGSGNTDEPQSHGAEWKSQSQRAHRVCFHFSKEFK